MGPGRGPTRWGSGGRLSHIADDRLAAFADRHVLHGDLLFTARSIALERLHLARKGPGKLVERALGAILLRDV